MSSVYVTEPKTNGKVIMKTTVGDLAFELWPQQAPLACRNFVQHCLDGYYNDTIFHRIIVNFIVQGGDPTGTGMGGEAAYGEPFPDEFNQRLRFNHRGILAMANTEGNDNKSQFFITLAETMQLQKKNTIFGKIVGDTIYNLMKMAELEVDSEDRPLYPPKIISTEVFVNPFDDIVQRVQPKVVTEKKVKKKKHKKNTSLLSFGEEAQEEEAVLETVAKKKMASAHDLLDDEKLLKTAVDVGDDEEAPVAEKPELAEGDLEKKLRKKLKRDRKRKREEEDELAVDYGEDEVDEKDGGDAKNDAQPSEAQREIKRLKKSILKYNDPNRMEKIVEDLEKKDDFAVTPLEKKRQQYLKKMGGKNINRQLATLEKLVNFRNKLKEAQAEGPKADTGDAKDKDWRSHVLKFEKDEEEEVNEDGFSYVVEDPLLEDEKKKKHKSVDRQMEEIRRQKPRGKW